MAGSERLRKTIIDRKRAESLLYPTAAFLHAGGLTKKDSLAVLSSVIDEIVKGERARHMEHIGHPTPYADVVAAWMRRKQFVDSSGLPRILPLSGPTGFATLVQKVSPGTKVRTVLSVLMRYRNVRRTKDGRYELLRPFFYANSHKTTAFEPIAYFLNDATATLSQILKQRQARYPEQFWRKVESVYVSEAIARKFAAFARERSLLFLEELDDWLEAHRRTAVNGTTKRRRVGLGLFSIYSSPEAATPKS